MSFAQLKEKLVPLIGVPATGFRLFQTNDNQQEQEILCLSDTLAQFSCDSKVFSYIYNLINFSLTFSIISHRL